MNTKKCRECQKVLPLSNFYEVGGKIIGTRGICKECYNRKRRETKHRPQSILTKQCSQCKKHKPVEEFFKDKRIKDGYKSMCKDCYKINQRRYRKNNIHPPINEGVKVCAGCGIEKLRTEFHNDKGNKDGKGSWCKSCEAKRAKRRTKATRVREKLAKYDMTEEEYMNMKQRQDNKCAICGNTILENGTELTIDHDHNTGRVRGLLCFSCNIGIGMFKDSPYLLQQAISYLSKNSKCEPKTCNK